MGVLLAFNFVIVLALAIVWRLAGLVDPPRTIGLMSGMLQVVFNAATIPLPTAERMGIKGVIVFYGAASFICPVSLQMVFDGAIGYRIQIAYLLVHLSAGLLTSILAIGCAAVIPRFSAKIANGKPTTPSEE
jgi:hypothetical protein